VYVPFWLTTAEPWTGPVPRAAERPLAGVSTSVSLLSTLPETALSSLVVVVSSTAIGGSLTPVTETFTVTVSVCPPPVRNPNRPCTCQGLDASETV
jgi:hypothetical protein